MEHQQTWGRGVRIKRVRYNPSWDTDYHGSGCTCDQRYSPQGRIDKQGDDILVQPRIIGHRICVRKQQRRHRGGERGNMVPWNNVGEQSDPNTKRTLIHVGPTMGGALTWMISSSMRKETVGFFLTWVKDGSPDVWSLIIMSVRDQAQLAAIRDIQYTHIARYFCVHGTCFAPCGVIS